MYDDKAGRQVSLSGLELTSGGGVDVNDDTMIRYEWMESGREKRVPEVDVLLEGDV